MLKRDPESPAGLLERQTQWLDRYQPGLRITEQGSVISVGDGIAWISGLIPRILITRLRPSLRMRVQRTIS